MGTDARTWSTPPQPGRDVYAVYDDDGYRWFRVHGGTDAEPSDYWECGATNQSYLWADLVRWEGPLTEVTAADDAEQIVASARDDIESENTNE